MLDEVKWHKVLPKLLASENGSLQRGLPSFFSIDPLVIEVMKEKGIDLSGRRPKGLNDLPPVEMDYLGNDGV